MRNIPPKLPIQIEMPILPRLINLPRTRPSHRPISHLVHNRRNLSHKATHMNCRSRQLSIPITRLVSIVNRHPNRISDVIRIFHSGGRDGRSARHLRPRRRTGLVGRRPGPRSLAHGHVPKQSAWELGEPDTRDVGVVLASGAKVAGDAGEGGESVGLVGEFSAGEGAAGGVPVDEEKWAVGDGAGGCVLEVEFGLAEEDSGEGGAVGESLTSKGWGGCAAFPEEFVGGEV